MDNFQHIKENIDLLSIIISETGLKMKGQHLEKCPFCGGHKCFSINKKDSFYKCFQCPDKTGGDIFTFLENYNNLDKKEALKMAAKFAGIPLSLHKVKSIELTVKEKIHKDTAEYYHTHMLSNGGSKYLLTDRGHTKNVLNSMQIGWSDGSLIEHLKNKNYSETDILSSGLAKETTHNGSRFLTDFFRKNLVIFPHLLKDKVIHFTIKDPQNKLKYQLQSQYRHTEWRCYNQDALKRNKEIIIVEGENDVLSLIDIGIKNVIGLIGQPSELQIKALKTHCVNKHIYLWLDKDEAGIKQTRQLYEALKDSRYNVRIIWHKGTAKDPDEFLKDINPLRAAGGKKIHTLQHEALTTIAWEIKLIQDDKNLSLEQIIKALKEQKIFMALSVMPEIEKLIYIEKLEELGLTNKAIIEEIEADNNLKNKLAIYYTTLQNPKLADANVIVSYIFKHFSQYGRFFYDKEDKVYFHNGNRLYTVGNNVPFNAYIKTNTNLLISKEPGRSVWGSLQSEGYTQGKLIDIVSWIHTDRNTDAIYVNFNSSNNIILKISNNEIKEIQNGLNEDTVLLKSSNQILPLNFLPDVKISEGMQLLKELIFDNLTCDKEQRYFIICWMMSVFLLDFVPSLGLMKFSGSTSSGKTTAARLLSILLYGNDHLGDPSTAAAYAITTQNPLLIIDNLESSDINKGILKFLINSANKGSRIKRTQNTDSGTIEEEPRALVIITAIEPFEKLEIINRIYDIEFSKKYFSDDFIEDEINRAIMKNRDVIMSSILKFISKDILPNLDKRKEYITILRKEYRGHSKDRTNEFIATLFLILEKLLKYIPFYEKNDFLYGMDSEQLDTYDREDYIIRQAWIDYQNAKARDTETASSSIIKLLDGLVKEYISKMKEIEIKPYSVKGYDDDVFVYQHPEYNIEMIKTKPETIEQEDDEPYTISYIEFVASSGDIVYTLDRFCKNNGIRNPYPNSAIFGQRLRNDIDTLKKSDWELVSIPKNEPYYKVIRGKRFWKFRKTLIK